MATRIGIYIWLTLPPGMKPDQAVAEVRTSVAFGRAEVKLQFVEEGAPDERTIFCTCADPGHPMCDDPHNHISCGCPRLPSADEEGTPDHDCDDPAPHPAHGVLGEWACGGKP